MRKELWLNAVARAGREVADAAGHAPSCRFHGCTCGAVGGMKAALLRFNKLWREAADSPVGWGDKC